MTRREQVGWIVLVVVAAGAAVFHFARPARQAVAASGTPAESGAAGTAGTTTQGGTVPPALVSATPAAGARVDLFNTIGQKTKLETADVDTLLRYMANTATDEDLIAARTAVAIGADRLKSAEIESGDRTRLENSLIATLSHQNWHMRLSSLSAIGKSSIGARPEVAERIRAMRGDPNEQVATLAKRISP